MKKALLLLLGLPLFAQAQTKIGDNPSVINANAVLELASSNKGFLLPRLALTSTTSFAPLTAHVPGMTVYNTASSLDVTPGFYYNDGSKWIRINDASNATTIYTGDGTLTGTRTVNIGGNNLYFNGTGNVAIGGNTATSTLDVNGSFSIPTRIVNSGTTTALSNTDHTLIITPALTSATFSVTMPAAAGVKDREYAVVNQSSYPKVITSYYDLNGNVQTTIPSNSSIVLQSDGTNWTQTDGLVEGAPIRFINSPSGATTLDATDHTVVFTNAVAAYTLTLPSATTNNGREYTIVNQSASPKTITAYYDLNHELQTKIGANTSITLQADVTGNWTETSATTYGTPTTTLNSGTAITLDGGDHTLVLTSAITNFAVTLPPATNVINREYTIVNQGSTTKTVTAYIDLYGNTQTTIKPNTSITVQSDGTNWQQTSSTTNNPSNIPGALVALYERVGTSQTTINANDSAWLAGDSVQFTTVLPARVVILSSGYMIPTQSSGCYGGSTNGFAEGCLRAYVDGSIAMSRYLIGYQYGNSSSYNQSIPVPAALETTTLLSPGAHNVRLQGKAWGYSQIYNFASSTLASVGAAINAANGPDVKATKTVLIVQVFNQ